jgi:cytochrome c oxidase cbb3-type subunit 1
MMAVRSVNSLTHYTDWTVAHVHAGAIGWVAMITIGSLYAMAPRALDRPAMHSTPAMNLHFWLHTSGLLLYVISMWAAGVTQGLMWRATNADGSLTHDFLSGLIATQPYYLGRFLGGALVLAGMVVMAWNLWHTAASARAGVIKPILVPAPEAIPEPVPDQFPAPLPERA